MLEIILKDSDVKTKKVDVEYINWTCPKCDNKNVTNEWLMDSLKKEIMCDKCSVIVKYAWSRDPNQYFEPKIENITGFNLLLKSIVSVLNKDYPNYEVEPKLVVLKGISKYGKDVVNNNKGDWSIVRMAQRVVFSTDNGPWILLESENKRESVWTKVSNNIDFIITLKNKQ